jgi:hypothetical protein
MPAKVGAFLHLSPRISPRHGRWCSKPDRPLSRRGAGGPLTYWPSAHADDTHAAVLEDETITNPQHSRAESRLCLEPGGAGLLALLASLKEGGKGDVEPPQCLRLPYRRCPAPVSLNALLRPEIALCAKHCVTAWPCASRLAEIFQGKRRRAMNLQVQVEAHIKSFPVRRQGEGG